jgi:hypothetical protein
MSWSFEDPRPDVLNLKKWAPKPNSHSVAEYETIYGKLDDAPKNETITAL